MEGGVCGCKEDVDKGMKKIEKGILGKGLCKMIGDILGGEGE